MIFCCKAKAPPEDVESTLPLTPGAEALLARFRGSHGYIKIDDYEREAARELVARHYAGWSDYELRDASNHLDITNGGRAKIGMK